MVSNNVSALLSQATIRTSSGLPERILETKATGSGTPLGNQSAILTGRTANPTISSATSTAVKRWVKRSINSGTTMDVGIRKDTFVSNPPNEDNCAHRIEPHRTYMKIYFLLIHKDPAQKLTPLFRNIDYFLF